MAGAEGHGASAAAGRGPRRRSGYGTTLPQDEDLVYFGALRASARLCLAHAGFTEVEATQYDVLPLEETARAPLAEEPVKGAPARAEEERSDAALYYELGQTDATTLLGAMALDVVVTLGKSIHELSELAGRTMPNVRDAYKALEWQGYSIPELTAVARAASIPQPEFNPEAARKRTRYTAPKPLVVDGAVGNAERRLEHAPPHAPPLPASHTYVHTPVFEPQVQEYFLWRKQKAKNRKTLQLNLAKLTLRSLKDKPPKLLVNDKALEGKLVEVLCNPNTGARYLDPLTTPLDSDPADLPDNAYENSFLRGPGGEGDEGDEEDDGGADDQPAAAADALAAAVDPDFANAHPENPPLATILE